MSEFQNLKSELIIRDQDSWEIMWKRSIAYYWDNMEACDQKGEDKLFHILTELGVKNIVNEGNGIVGFKAFKTGSDSSEASAPQILKVRICTNEHREHKPKYLWREAFSNTNSWRNLAVDLTIKLPPIMNSDYAAQSASILADYSSMSLYFPFGEKFTTPYEGDSSEYNFVERAPKTSFAAYTPEKAQTTAKRPNAGMGALGDNEHAALSQQGDRGGSEGLDDDFRWLHFVPRMVAYNWLASDEERIKPGTSLSEYPELLKALGYTIPKGLNVILEYADYLPRENDQFNINDYTSVLSIDFPAPPTQEGYKPIALADFMAQRANMPFTCS
jgi:hypothetical protein